ncbi:hypothetical protein [Pseudoxanthomonas sp. PXM04]|uniref:hypothetical protein n=1 Tax=Pseudoxanthomonas sp. PXM04 TaxID=2769297 RepID=UPI00178204E6|nr:hypothetical protein [Pseudoxanthomonas sp. PXM04]MBD9379547.1 hypothetical protein [Pseudoxanthomonas sp. PXM04]
MNDVILLYGTNDFERERWDDLPELVERRGLVLSRKAGPRTPLPTDHEWDPVSIYASDDLTEEEFQELYEANRVHVTELNLKY